LGVLAGGCESSFVGARVNADEQEVEDDTTVGERGREPGRLGERGCDDGRVAARASLRQTIEQRDLHALELAECSAIEGRELAYGLLGTLGRERDGDQPE